MSSSVNNTSFQKQTPVSSSQTGAKTAPKKSRLSPLPPEESRHKESRLSLYPPKESRLGFYPSFVTGGVFDGIPRFSRSTQTPSAQEEPWSRSPQIVGESPISRKFRSISDNNCSGSIVGVYITTNEKGAERTIAQLKHTPPSPRSMHVGFSGWHNFDIMAARQVECGLICDFNPRNKKFIDATLRILKASNTRQEFVANMMQIAKAIRGQITGFFSHNFERESVDAEEEIALELTTPGSWLSSEKNFQFIKALAKTDSIAAITLDIRNTSRFKRIANIAQSNDIQIDTLYLSNICQYMYEPKDKRSFLGTVHTLARPETTVINCPITGNDLTQEILPGTVLQKPENDVRLFAIDSLSSQEAREQRERILKQLSED